MIYCEKIPITKKVVPRKKKVTTSIFESIKLNHILKVISYYFEILIKLIKSNIYNIFRYAFVGISLIILYKFIQPYQFEKRTLMLLVFLEILAIMLSGLSLFIFTKINFIKGLTNEKRNSAQSSYYILLGLIFLSVHICIGLSILGLYITQITN